MALTREQAAAAVTAAAAERDGISANLLDLDGSFGKRLLDGAKLAGLTKERWDRAAADLAALWDIFTAYSAVVDAAAELAGRLHRASGADLQKISDLLYGASVRVSMAPRPLARRDLTETGQQSLTLVSAIARMRPAFASVTEVVTAAETVWNQIAGPLADIGTGLETTARRAGGLGDTELASTLAAASAELASVRALLNSDPLSLGQDGQGAAGRLDRLRRQAEALATRATTLAAIRDNARQRIGSARSAVAAAGQAWQDAMAARERAASRISLRDGDLPAGQPPRELTGLSDRAAALDSYASGGRWPALAAEIEAIEKQAAGLTAAGQAAARAAADLLARRDELRGLLDAYQAKAARLGGAEDAGLTERYRRSHDLLWTAPCDLDAAAAAVTAYQQAISALDGRGRTR